MKIKDILFLSVSKPAIIFTIICAADLISTAIILVLGGGEANSIMDFLLKRGGLGLIALVKLTWFCLTICYMELVQKGLIFPKKKELLSPRSVRNYYLAGITLYIMLYGIGFVIVNF